MGRNNSLSSMSSLRRSVILDRLTQMTSDIQEQLQLDGYNEDEDEEEQEEDAGEVEEELDEDKHKEDDETEKKVPMLNKEVVETVTTKSMGFF